jgi:phosphate-selective porin OprO and OprP
VRAGRPALVLSVLLVVAPAPGKQAAAQEKKKEPPPGWQARPFAIEKPSADFRLALQGYVQADFRSFPDWPSGEDSASLHADELEWRRVRVGVDGRWKRVSWQFEVDPASTEIREGKELRDAWMGLRIVRALQVRGGHMKLPVSFERLVSNAKTDFLERSAVVEAIAPTRDWGVMLHGEVGRVLEYQAGLFDGDGSQSSNRAGTTGAGRLVFKPARWLDLGGSYAQGEVRADPVGEELEANPKGFSGWSESGFRFFPPLFVEGRRLRWGADAHVQAGPAALWGEFLEGREQRRGQGPNFEALPELRGDGWSVTATWLVTGEKKTRTIRPDRSLFGGPGAVEIGVRYQELWFDDVSDEGFESAGNRAANVRPAGFRAFTAGLSWWPSSFLRLVGNVLVERFDDSLRSPQPGKDGSYVSVLGRVQVHLP